METCVLTPNKGTSSPGIQNALDKTGTLDGGPLKYSAIRFSKGEYLINSRLFLNDNTTLTFDSGAILKLMDDSPNFGSQVPIIGQSRSSITGLDITGIVYDGNYAKQGNTPGDHGLGYGNLFKFSNITNSIFRQCQVDRNEGDGWRIEGGSNLTFEKCTGSDGGHDVIHMNKCSKVDVLNCDVEIRANNAVRVRSSSDILIDGCKFHDFTSNAWAPPIQLENITTGTKCRNIEIRNCLIQNVKGPGIWGIGNVPLGDAADVHIHHNILKDCGLMDAGNQITGVGGVVMDGFTDVSIEDNVFDNCRGNAIGFGSYIGRGGTKGCKATVRENTIVNTRKALYPGVGSGYGIANVLGKEYYTVQAYDNTFKNNVGNYFGAIDVSAPIEEETDEEEHTEKKPAFIMLECSESQLTDLETKYPEMKILRKR